MIWPGVKGSTAKRVSTVTKAIDKGMVAQREDIVRGLRHERLLPRLRPNSRAKMVRIRSKAPRMSMRGSCFLQGVSDCRFGRWRKKPTAAIAIRHRSTWIRKALPSEIRPVFSMQANPAYHLQPIVCTKSPPSSGSVSL